jgi:Flp pilus assembly protein TadG
LPDILPRILRAEAGSVAVEFASAVVPLLGTTAII